MAPSCLHVAIIADDLTGAMDAAAPFARRGLDVRVLTTPDFLEKVSADPPQVLSVNTGTRHAGEATAAHVVSILAEKMTRLKPAVLFKKIDSTLRGHVVAETIAAMNAAGCRKVVLCPAVPSQGRSLVGGEVYINGVILRETAIGQDLRSPPPTVPLSELFRAALPGTPAILQGDQNSPAIRSDERVPQIRIIDATSDEHLLTMANSAIEEINGTLLVGASGLTEALADALLGPEGQPLVPTALSGKELFVIGSQAPPSIAQIEALVEAPSPTFVIKQGPLPLSIEEWQRILLEQKSPRLLLRAPSRSRKVALDSDVIAKNLGKSAAALVSQTQIGLLVATGGDTALAVLDALEVNCITLCGEIQPGVPHGLIETQRGPLRLVTKAGGFGDRGLFCSIGAYFAPH